jgi:DNA-binding NarL/FixJ family response regulator
VALIRVLLAGNHEEFLRTLRGELSQAFEVVGTVKDGKDAIDAVRRVDPDVLVIDISMPIRDGLQAAEDLRDANCRTKIVFLTIHEQSDYVSAAFAAGASGYVTKRHLGTDLAPAIHAAFQGDTFISPSLHRNYTN